MEYSQNHIKADPSYVFAVDDDVDNEIISKFTAFNKGTESLVVAFRKEIEKHGSINSIPRDVLQKYCIPFSTLLELSRNLREDIEKQVDKNNKDLEYIRSHCYQDIELTENTERKKESLSRKIEYFDDIEIYHAAIEFWMNRN